jgi:hypothetical protein
MTRLNMTVILQERDKPAKVISDVTRDFDYDVQEWSTIHPLKRDENGDVLSYVANVGKRL